MWHLIASNHLQFHAKITMGNPSIPEAIFLEVQDQCTKNNHVNEEILTFRAKRWPQYYSALSAQVGGFALGASWFWTATALPDLARSREFGEISNSQRAWITSFTMIGAMVVCPLSGYCMSHFGRRRSMLWSTIPSAGSWILIAMAQNIPMIYIGRLISGMAAGNFAQIVPIFVAECAESEIRGTLMCLFEIMICLGTVFIYIVGAFTSWRVQAFVCGIIPLIGHALMFFAPESPYFLMEKDKDKEASSSLRWLRGAESIDQISQELSEISDCVRRNNTKGDTVDWQVLKDKSILKPILLTIGLMTFFQGSFINAILAAAVEIFQSAGSYNEYMSTIVLGIIQTVATAIPLFIADKCGRKILIVISLALVATSLTSLGFFFHFKNHYGQSYVEDFSWVPLTSLILYVVACSIGIVPLSWVISAEIAPPKAKGLAGTICSVWNRCIGFVVVFAFWDMNETFGQDGTYWFIASVNVIAILFIITCIPETKGKTLDEIQMHFLGYETSRL